MAPAAENGGGEDLGRGIAEKLSKSESQTEVQTRSVAEFKNKGFSIRAAKNQSPGKNGRGVEPPLVAPNPPLPPIDFGVWRWTRTKVRTRGIWGFRGLGRGKEAPEARGWPGAVRGVCGKGREREGRAEGAKGEGNTPFSIKLIWIGFEIWRGAEPPLGRRTPPPLTPH